MYFTAPAVSGGLNKHLPVVPVRLIMYSAAHIRIILLGSFPAAAQAIYESLARYRGCSPRVLVRVLNAVVRGDPVLRRVRGKSPVFRSSAPLANGSK